jgi:hypothetical protein
MKESLRLDHHDEPSDSDTLMLCGGLALAVFGVGLMLSNRNVRQLLGNVKPGALIAAAAPDFERYLKLRAM